MASELHKDKDSDENDDNDTVHPCEQNKTVLDDLPDEILEFILTYIPPYSDLKNCSLVNKRWNDVVSNMIHRAKMNFQKGLVDFRLHWNKHNSTLNDGSTVEVAKGTALQGPLLPAIAGRFAHSAVRYSDYMYIFGGGSSSDTTFNDLWRYNLNRMCWERPLSMGTYPSPKGSASMVNWRDQLILFGGWRYPSIHPPYQPWCLFDELHYYDLQHNRWTAYVNINSPPPMAGHSATVHGNRMIIFGGYQIKDEINVSSNETWVLNLHEQHWWQPIFVGNIRPTPRYGQIQVALDEYHLLVMGGCGGANRLYSDVWLLDMSTDIWSWHSISVRNKKFGAVHMWCNPAVKVNSYLVVVGPTPNMPQDFQMMKHRIIVGPTEAINVDNQRFGVLGQPPPPGPLHPPNYNLPRRRVRQVVDVAGVGAGAGVGAVAGAIERILGPIQLVAVRNGQEPQLHRMGLFNNNNNNNSNNNNNNIINNNHNIQPRTGRLSDLHAPVLPPPPPPPPPTAPSGSRQLGGRQLAVAEQSDNRPSGSAARTNRNRNSDNNEDEEAANRLQRNLALRCRDNEPLLPLRFDEVYEDRFRMAAFNVTNRSRSSSRDHNERIRRMEEKMNALRNSRRNVTMPPKEPTTREPSPKRVRRNVQSLFVCDLTHVMHPKEPYVEWLEYKNFGVVPGAPDRLILSSLIAGNGELVLFGGVHKETINSLTHHVSNTVHFLYAPRDIV